MDATIRIMRVLAFGFVFVIGLAAAIIVVMFVIERMQREDAIWRNFPVIGRFRHLFSALGEFFRQ